MSRNKVFNPEREPLRNRPDVQLNKHKIHGPISFLNPTQAHYDHVPSAKSSTAPETSAEDATEQPTDTSNLGYKWTSRDNRKGRHALVVKPSEAADAKYAAPPPTTSLKEITRTIGRMLCYYPVWDVSYLVAVVFTWGSVIWVINAFFAFLPFTNPSTEFPGETLYGGGITAFIGATVFEIGSVLLMLEAVNENRAGCFGWALERAYEGCVEHGVGRVKPDGCTHHHGNRGNLVGKPPQGEGVAVGEKNPTVSTDGMSPGDKSWVWWPSWHELRTHSFHDLGFIACSAQMFGATVFWISGFTALPGIYDHLSPVSVLNGVYWVPQVVGGTGFVVSGTLFMIETQKHWWQPAFGVLGWHIGLWNLIGGIGFTLCPIFGFGTAYWREYQASCSTFWGSWAFLIGSVIQLYESLVKHPVEMSREQS
ncbi:Uu.00g003710.m01.CDS01 [Anthostomella pinea]|uniref:Uu.00g003710.m01.CDS01 n=1 Tax=Anthostomella pinea TaxID=933095 RepID=A0AAI8YIM3_9PEZI|nr:Uu.00g003710.m01.CDS01 [Anthostomella pinea]